jgi:hypothetical protein
MDILKRLSLAFAAGCFGVLFFYAAFRAGLEAGLLKPPPPAFKFLASKAFFYKQVVWGGIWGLAFIIPVLKGKWWLRGLIVGFAATMVAFFVFRGGLPPVPVIVAGLVLNMVFWGLAAAYWNDKVLKNA